MSSYKHGDKVRVKGTSIIVDVIGESITFPGCFHIESAFSAALVEGDNLIPVVERVTVDLFKPNGKFYTSEEWRVPEGAIGPTDMDRSPDYREIDGGPVLVTSSSAWGFPTLILGEAGR